MRLTQRLTAVILISVFIAVSLSIWQFGPSSGQDGVNSFETCRDADGSQLLETYPTGCRTAAGQTFTQKIDNGAGERVQNPYQGTRVTSRTKAFSISIPDGWMVYNSRDDDRMVAIAQADIVAKAGRRPTVATLAPTGGQPFNAFGLYASPLPEENLATGDASPFGTIDGFTVTRYTRTYAASESTAGGATKDGDTVFTYNFVAGDGRTPWIAQYFKAADQPNRQASIEQVLRTVDFK